GLSNMQMGYVFSVFALAYAVFEIPAGWWGDRVGQKKVLVRIVACWSAFTILTGMVRSYGALVATRFVFGAAEAGAFPTLARALARWFPAEERARANGVMWMGARVGGSVAPALAALLIARIGWRATFAVFGAIGIAWCAVFQWWYRDEPGGSMPAPAHPEPTPWGRIFTSGTLWKLFGMYFCSAYGFWFFVTWLPTFLMREHGLTLEQSGAYASLPLAAGALGCAAGGLLADWLVRRTGSLKWGRRLIGMGGFWLAATGFGVAVTARSPLAAVLWLAFASGAHDLTLSVGWATAVEVGGRFGGTTSAVMNMASSLSAMLSAVSAAWLAQRFGSFNVMIGVAAGVYFIGGLLWTRISPPEPTRPGIGR
ncbi:MAG: MFS transporter, partial [Acidobacteria bacterium]|nr:MFS transporter [Acidobacteriota bacterium]